MTVIDRRSGLTSSDDDGLDGRTNAAKHYRNAVQALTVEVGNNPSPTQTMLIKRAAALSVWSEECERRYLNGDEIAATPMLDAASELRQLFQQLGIGPGNTKPAATHAGYLGNR